MESIPFQWLLVHDISDCDFSTDYEVHFQDLLIFIINHAFTLLVAETSWFETKGHVVKEFAIFVFLSIEKEAELVKYIIEKIVDDKAPSNRSWQCCHEFIVFLYLSEPIIRPIIFEMGINLAVKRIW